MGFARLMAVPLLIQLSNLSSKVGQPRPCVHKRVKLKIVENIRWIFERRPKGVAFSGEVEAVQPITVNKIVVCIEKYILTFLIVVNLCVRNCSFNDNYPWAVTRPVIAT